MIKDKQFAGIVNELHEEFSKIPEGDDKVKLDEECIKKFK